MRRAIAVALALVASVFAVPASSAPETVTYEVVRQPWARTVSEVWVEHLERGVVMAAVVAPAGGSYEQRSALMTSGERGFATGTEFELRRGWRMVVGGQRGAFRVRLVERGWSLRQVPNAFRVVTASASDHRPVAGPVEEYGTASAPGGRWGSVAYAVVPCYPGVGTWTVATDAGESWSHLCDPLWPTSASDFAGTVRGRRWTVEADVRGMRGPDFRLAVLDYPKPAGR